MAVTLTVVVLLGFSRTYFLVPLIGQTIVPPPMAPTPLVHLHGAVFTAWLALLVLQVRLVANRKTSIHRRLGVAGAILALLMIVIGTLTALHAAARGNAAPGVEPLRFLAIPLFDLIVFSTLIALALAKRKDSQAHKRWMLLATIGLLPPAIARWTMLVLGLPAPLVFLLSLLFVAPLVHWDLRTRGRLHAATLWGGLILLVSGPLRIAVSGTAAWYAFATWAVGLVR
jgi:hypothetical protein